METADFHGVLEALRGRRARLDVLIAALEAEAVQAEGGALEPGAGISASAGPALAIHPDTFFGLSLMEAAKKYLRLVRRAQHTSAIADALARGGLKRPQESTLSSLLVRAAKGRDIIKVGKAMWGLSEWYPKQLKDPGEPPSKENSGQRPKRGAPKKAKTTAPKTKATPTPETVAASSNGAGVSELVREVLRTAGKPVHTKAIIEQVHARGNSATKATISSLLAVWAKQGKVKRTAPGTFSL